MCNLDIFLFIFYECNFVTVCVNIMSRFCLIMWIDLVGMSLSWFALMIHYYIYLTFWWFVLCFYYHCYIGRWKVFTELKYKVLSMVQDSESCHNVLVKWMYTNSLMFPLKSWTQKQKKWVANYSDVNCMLEIKQKKNI